jgi:ribonucleoside-diphosphate reductase alpha chain
MAEMLIKLGIRYGSEESIKLCDSIGFAMINYAIQQSALLAKEYGAYPKYNAEAVLSSPFFKHNITDIDIIKLVEKYGLRNSQLLTCAPTGSLSTMLGISGGLEPIYSLSYNRKTQSLHGEDVSYTVYTPIVEEFLDYIDGDKDNLPDYFMTAMTLDYQERIDMQSIWQTHIDAAISSTVNVENSFTVEEVEKLYLYAWAKGLKGVTIYRDGCQRSGILTQIESNDIDDDEDEELEDYKDFELPRGFIEESPDDLAYRKYKLRTGCGNLYFFVGVDENEGKIYDCFTNTDGVGGCMVNTQANSRLLSAGLRGGIPIEYLVHQLEKSGTCASYQNIRGRQTGALKIKNLISKYTIPQDILTEIDDYVGKPLSNGKSCASACAYVLKNILKEFEGQEHEELSYSIVKKDEILKDTTTECKHENLRNVEGCVVCCDCGYSKCG